MEANTANPSVPSIPERLRWQADWCSGSGPRSTASLLARAAAASSGRAVRAALARHEEDPLGSALPVRFMGAVHRLVSGRRSELAAFYPSTGGGRGRPAGSLLGGFRRDARGAGRAPSRADRPPGPDKRGRARSAALLGGFLLVGARDRAPAAAVRDRNSSAGLNLRFDRYRFDWGERCSGTRRRPVRFDQPFAAGCPPERRPPRGHRTPGLRSQPARRLPRADDRLTLCRTYGLTRSLRAHLLGRHSTSAQRVPAVIDDADEATAWLGEFRTGPRELDNVVFQSIVADVLERGDLGARIGRRDRSPRGPQGQGPVRLAADGAGTRAGRIRLKQWPGGTERRIARAATTDPR